MTTESPAARNLVWHRHEVSRAQRELVLGQTGRLIWLTGLSGSGKSTIATRLDARLNAYGRATYLLDGDNVRHGLCSDLGFSDRDREENLRRVAEVGRLFVDAGLITIAAFISPFQRDRDVARARLATGDFVEVWVSTPLAVCESRDPKGLYAKARRGEIPNFTGISSPYEPPTSADVVLDTSVRSVDECVDELVQWLEDHPSPSSSQG